MARSRGPRDRGHKKIEALLEEILVDAYGEEEQLWAFRQAFEDEVRLPADAFVMGEPVSVVDIDYDGNTRCGLKATCRFQKRGKHSIPASEVRFPDGSAGDLYVAAYRKWLGLQPFAMDGHLKPSGH